MAQSISWGPAPSLCHRELCCLGQKQLPLSITTAMLETPVSIYVLYLLVTFPEDKKEVRNMMACLGVILTIANARQNAEKVAVPGGRRLTECTMHCWY